MERRDISRLYKRAGKYSYIDPVYLTEEIVKARHYRDVRQTTLNKSQTNRRFKLPMALIRWQPFQEMESLRRQMDQMFDEMVAVNHQTQLTWKPAVELQDTAENIILRAEIPGVEGKDLDIQVTRKAVAIAGEHRYEKKAEEKGFFRTEFRYGKFQRVVNLPVAVQNDQVKAEFKDGILTLTLPKVAEASHKVVKVNLTNTDTNNGTANGTAVNSEANETESSQTAETV